MSKYLYKKGDKRDLKRLLRFFAVGMIAVGLFAASYIIFPLLSWEIYLRPVFASQSFASPIPSTTIITKDYLQSLIRNTSNSLRGIDYNNLENWFPSAYKESQVKPQVSSYSISIPKLKIENAAVSTVDNDLSTHLIHFPGTSIPPNKGTGAVFGHSTLPQLYDPKNYKTIFANVHKLTVGDRINVVTNNTLYTYKIITISITGPEDTSYLMQDYSDSYLTIITCTPPGTTWKRLIIKSKLERM